MGFLSDFGKGFTAGLFGPVGANAYGAYEDKKATEAANQQNIASANEQMRFQERMSNTSYQRAMDDMKKAGLNPMLAMSTGGASTPAGAMGTVNPASKGQGRAMSKSYEQIMNGAATASNMQNQSIQTQSNVELQSAQTAQSQANIHAVRANTVKTEAETAKTIQEAKQSADTFEDRKNLLKTERKMRDLDADWQKAEKIMKAADSVTGTLSNLNPFKGFLNPKDNGNSARRPPRPTGRSERTENYNANGEHTGTTTKEFKFNFD